MDPFRALFLRQVRHIVTSKPGKEALYQLLRTVSPELTEEDVSNLCKRSKAFKELNLRIQPDNPDDNSVIELFRKVQKFYDACCRRLGVPSNKKKPVLKAAPPTKVPTSESTFPIEFNVTDKWSFVSCNHPITPNREALSAHNNSLDILTAYLCINARGAVAHGAKPGVLFSWNIVEKNVAKYATAEQLFSEKFKGARRLEGVNAIKEELTTRGPVVSTSFLMSQNFANTTTFSQAFDMQSINQKLPLLIVGWKLTAFGEVWLVHPPAAGSKQTQELIPVAMGQFGIDDMCLAPESNLEDIAWQSGPFLDLNVSSWPPEWRSWKKIDIHLSSSELESLFTCFNSGFVDAKEKKTRFVIRDKNKIAHSRACNVNDVCWDETKKKWKVSAQFIIK
jgi:hypothetical protein